MAQRLAPRSPLFLPARAALLLHSSAAGASSAASASGEPQALESFLESFLEDPEAAQDLLSRHPELAEKVTAGEAQRSIGALLDAKLSPKTLRALVRSCPRLLWKGPEFARELKAGAGGASVAVQATGQMPPALKMELLMDNSDEPDYDGYWEMDYNPVHSSLTGMPCRRVHRLAGAGAPGHASGWLACFATLYLHEYTHAPLHTYEHSYTTHGHTAAELASAIGLLLEAGPGVVLMLPSLDHRHHPVPFWCRWVGGPRPPLELYVDRLLQLTTLAHSLPANGDKWSDDE